MEGSHIEIPVQALRDSKGDDYALRKLIVPELYELSQRHRVPFAFMIPLLDPTLKEVKKQVERMLQGDGDAPYPPPHLAVLSVQIAPPAEGRVGISTFETGRVKV